MTVEDLIIRWKANHLYWSGTKRRIYEGVWGYTRIYEDVWGYTRMLKNVRGCAKICEVVRGFSKYCEVLWIFARFCVVLRGFMRMYGDINIFYMNFIATKLSKILNCMHKIGVNSCHFFTKYNKLRNTMPIHGHKAPNIMSNSIKKLMKSQKWNQKISTLTLIILLINLKQNNNFVIFGGFL